MFYRSFPTFLVHTNSKISMQIQYDKPTGLMMGGQYPELQRSAQIKNNTASCSVKMLILFTLKPLFSLCTSLSACVAGILLFLHLPLSLHTNPSPPSEDSSSTFTLMFTLHCRKGLQSEGMERGCSARQSIHNQRIIRRFPDI